MSSSTSGKKKSAKTDPGSDIGVFVYDEVPRLEKALRSQGILVNPKGLKLKKLSIVFVVSSSDRLNEAATKVASSDLGERLQGFFLRNDPGSAWARTILRSVSQSGLFQRKSFVEFDDPEAQPQRVLSAWACGAQRDLIADAAIVGAQLLVRDCTFEELVVPLANIPPLRGQSLKDLEHFFVDEDGSCIEWPELDVHLDLEALRLYADPAQAARQRARAAVTNRNFGKVLRSLREEAGLKQSDFDGVSSRQIRRIERGECYPRPEALSAISHTFGHTENEFLNLVSEKMT